MNTYQKVMLIVAAFWAIWSLEILYRKQNWTYEESNIKERITWAIFSGVMVVTAIILDVLGKFK